MTLYRVPAEAWPKTSSRPLLAGTRRLTRAGTSVISRPSASTRSTVRCGRAVCPPGPVSRTVTLSAAAVIGPTRRPTWPTGRLRVAVQREDLRHVVQAAGLDDLQRAAGQDLLGRLEDQPDPAVQLAAVGELGQQHADAEQDRGVHVVAAGVADALHGGAVRHVLGVVQRQGVDVGAQRDDRAVGPAVDVADHAVALGQQPRAQPGQR